MDKNSIIGFVLIGAIFIGFTLYQSHQAKEQMEYKRIQDSIALANMPIPVPEDSTATAVMEQAAPAVEMPAVAAQPEIYKDALLGAAHSAEESIVALENESLRIEFTTRGAQPWSALLKDFRNHDSTDLYLFRGGASELSANIYTGEYVATKEFVFNVVEQTDSTLVMQLPFSGGGCLEQAYTLPAKGYSLFSELRFKDLDTQIPRNVSSFDLDYSMVIPRMEKGFRNESQYSKVDWYFNGDKKPSEMGKGRNNSKRIDSRLSWFAFQQQFFSAIVYAPKDYASGELAVNFFEENDPDRNLMACSAKMRMDLPRGADASLPLEFYFGPNNFHSLKEFDRNYEKIIPLGGSLVGWFTRFVIIPLFNFFNRFFSNFGLIILLMTLVIKLVVLPFTYKSFSSSAKMQALKPLMEKINEKFPKKEDAMKKQQATMDLYKRAGVSPLGGCLPTLLTFPILWAMYRFFPASIELRQQSFLWCHDLSSYDSIVDFGTRIPILGDHLSLFALLMAATMWIYSKLTVQSTAGNDPNAASMRFMSVWMMPIMMFFICNSLSAALSYYYLLSQLISIVEIYIIKKFFVHPEQLIAKVKASEGKPLPKSKFQQRLEAAQKMQQEQMKKRNK
ncbi:MAG: membrane protein insertase YidC [Bacteroidales bacterium]|nr:membrane protein insertase YidC [Bacteroidales bacterium]